MRYWTVKEAAQYFRVSPRTIYNWIDFGYLRAIKVGKGKGTIRIPEDAIKEFENKHLTVEKSENFD